MVANFWYDNEWGYSCKTVDLICYLDSVEKGTEKSIKKTAKAMA